MMFYYTKYLYLAKSNLLLWKVSCFLLFSFAFSHLSFSQNEPTTIKDLGNGFYDYGVAVPIASSRGTVATTNSKGENIVLTWLMDGRGTYGLLMVNVDTNESKQFYLPFSGYSYTSLLSKNGCYYTHFENHFVEFDPNKPGFSFIKKTPTGTGRSMTQDENGIIWMGLSPNARLLAYDPDSIKLTDYGIIYKDSARQLVKEISAAKGLIYLEIGVPGKEKVAIFDPVLKETVLEEESSMKKVEKRNQQKSFITGNQALFKRHFSVDMDIKSSSSMVHTDFLATREIHLQNKNGDKPKSVKFDYQTEGALLMGIAIDANDNIIGGSYFPFHFFKFNPSTSRKELHKAYGQFNTLAVNDQSVFFGSYPQGAILKWNSNEKLISTKKNEKTNPNIVASAHPNISRPHDLIVTENGRTAILAGRPVSQLTEAGLLFLDIAKNKNLYLAAEKIVSNQSTTSLVQISEKLILGGTTIIPGDDGGKPLAENSKLYMMDLRTLQVIWQDSPIPNVKGYKDLISVGENKVLGLAGSDLFFVFDYKTKQVLKTIDLREQYESSIPFSQGQRVFIKGDNSFYLLLSNQILEFNPQDLSLSSIAKSPIPISAGGAYLNGKLFFVGNKSHICSYDLK